MSPDRPLSRPSAVRPPPAPSAFDREWRTRFERFAHRHVDDAGVSGWSPVGLERRLRTVRSLVSSLPLPASALALDVGCGAGTYVRLLAGLGHRAVGLDYSLPSLGRATTADPGRTGRYLGGDAYALPFAPGRFDLVTVIGVLQALGEPERVLDETARVLRPGGLLVVEALNRRAIVAGLRRAVEVLRGQPPHLRTYDPRAVRRWLAARGLTLLDRVALCLPPRRLPGAGRLLATWPLGALLERAPVVSSATAHTFLYVARKTASPSNEPAAAPVPCAAAFGHRP